MNHFFKFSILFFVIFWLVNCQNQELEFSVEYHRKIQAKIKRLDFLRNKLKEQIDFNIGEFKRKMNGALPNFKAMSWDWKAKSSNFEYEYNRLYEELVDLRLLSRKYFKKLKTITDSIKDDSLRKLELKTNKAYIKEWEDVYFKAQKQLFAFGKLLKKKEDIFKVIVNSGLRQKPANSIQTLTHFHQETNLIFGALEKHLKKLLEVVSIPNSTQQLPDSPIPTKLLPPNQ